MPDAQVPNPTPLLDVRGVTMRYDDAPVLRDVSLSVAEGEIFAVIGPSGCGKTSLLRVIGGLERAEAGGVWLAGERIDGVPSHRRGIGMMFQELALFPHLDVRANVAFGLRMQGLAREPREARVEEMLELVGLSGYGGRKVHELSGGERQRVALARSLAPGPRLLMLDEPVGALDRALREDLLSELSEILRAQGLTAIYVTHDQEEAFALADRVIVMDAGRVRQSGRPEDVYGAPADAWVARFLGRTNLIPGEVIDPVRADAASGRSSRAESRDSSPATPDLSAAEGSSESHGSPSAEEVPASAPAPPLHRTPGARPHDVPRRGAMERGLGGEAGPTRVRTRIGEFRVNQPDVQPGPVTLLLGDAGARVASRRDGEPCPSNTICGRVLKRSFQGRLLRLRIRCGEHDLTFAVDPPSEGETWTADDEVRVTLDPASIRVLPDANAERDQP